MSDALLFTTTRVCTFLGDRLLTAASGFFFAADDDRVFLVTSRHVLLDAASRHHPDRIEVELHVDAKDLTRMVVLSRRLYGDDGRAAWRQGADSGGEIDVAVLPIDTAELPEGARWHCFRREHLVDKAAFGAVPIGQPLLIVGYPLGFHDTVHHLPVARQAAVASAFGVRFQGQGCFLTDARTHRGSSGAPVVRHKPALADGPVPWQLLGVHSSRMDMITRDRQQDESLGLNVAWYADILLTLVAKPA